MDGFFLLESFNHAVASTTEEVEEGVEEGLREDDEDDEEEEVLEAVLDDDLLPDGEMLGTTVSVLFFFFLLFFFLLFDICSKSSSSLFKSSCANGSFKAVDNTPVPGDGAFAVELARFLLVAEFFVAFFDLVDLLAMLPVKMHVTQ